MKKYIDVFSIERNNNEFLAMLVFIFVSVLGLIAYSLFGSTRHYSINLGVISFTKNAAYAQGGCQPASKNLGIAAISAENLEVGQQVNIFDLSKFLSNWGSNDGQTDLNNDGVVNNFDFSIFLSNWGS